MLSLLTVMSCVTNSLSSWPTYCSSTATTYDRLRLLCSGCRQTQAGREYTGSVSQTVSGRQCQRWSSNSPHVLNSDYTDDKFAEGSRAAAANYCRNPDASFDAGVWCYTLDPNVRWERCNVPLCTGNCDVVAV